MSKLDRILVFTFLACSVLLFHPAAYGKDENRTGSSCVVCHFRLPGSSFVGVKSHSWKGSIH